MLCPTEQFSDFSSFRQQADYVSDTKQDGVHEVGINQPVYSLVHLVEALR